MIMDDLDKLIEKARLSGCKIPKRLLEERAKAEQKGGDEALDERIRDILNQELYNQSMEMRRQLEAAREQRSRYVNTSHDGIARSNPPEKQARSRICHCEICRQPIALLKDPKSIRVPFKPDDFIGIHHDRDIYPPFDLRATWQWMRCWWCGNRPWNEPNKILVSDGFFQLPEKSEGVRINRDVKSEQEDKNHV